jgi:dihydrolipoamide dehydrogenase
VREALAYRDVMVSDYSDAGQQQYLARKGIDLIRGTGRLSGPGVVEVEGVPQHRPAHCGGHRLGPAHAALPGLHELDGLWTNREVTGMKAVPRRLLILGGGPVGAEMAKAVRRLGGEVALSEGAGHVLAREPDPLGHALGEVLGADGAELFLGTRATAARRDGADYVLTPDDGRELAATTCSWPPADARGCPPAWTRSATPLARTATKSTRTSRVGERLRAIGDVTGIRLLTHVGTYQGEVASANVLGEPREARYEAIPDIVYTDPQAAAVGATEATFSATVPVSEVAKTATYTHAYATANGFLTLLSDGDQRRHPPQRGLLLGIAVG